MSPLDDIIAAHGGKAAWGALHGIDAVVSVRGFLFLSKGVPKMERVRVSVDTREPRTVLHDYPKPGLSSHFLGESRVEIRDAAGTVVQARDQPRREFGGLRRFFRWDALDFAYFCGYAMWNYLSMPFLLQTEGVETACTPTADGGTRVDAVFPAGFPTHCRRQSFRFAANGELLRHDYTAEVVGQWATAAHLSGEYREFDGLRLPTRRRVYPKFFGDTPLPAPTLVAIDIHDVRPRR